MAMAPSPPRQAPGPQSRSSPEIPTKPAPCSMPDHPPGAISAVTQINVQLPAGVTGDHVPIYFLAGGLVSQSGVTIAVK